MVDKLLGERGAAVHFKLRNLVADSPDHDRRMIAVSQHHRRNILLPPRIEVAAVIELDLVCLPDVEGLIKNQQAKTVARVEECGRRRVVRRAHRIHAGSFQQLHPSLFRAIKRRGAERPVVVMDAAPGQLDRLAV